MSTTAMLPENFRRVGIISPAFPSPDATFDAGVAALRRAGAEVTIFPGVRSHAGEHPYFSAPDAARRDDLVAALESPNLDWVLCARGGFGCARICDQVNWAKFRHVPLAGYSDITALHFAALSLQSPVIPFMSCMIKGFADAIDGLPTDFVAALLKQRRHIADVELINGNRNPVSALPLAGNLMVVASLCGTKFLPPSAGKIILLEDVGERAYRIDRTLTQLRLAGFFRDVAAIFFGDFTDCDNYESVLRDFAATMDCPIGVGVPFGHGGRMTPLRADQRLVFDGKTLYAD